MKNFLQEGDVVFLKRGMKVHAQIPEKFVHEGCKLSKELTKHVVEVGKYLSMKPDVTRDIEMLANDIVKSFESKLGLKIKAADATVFITSKLPAIKTDSYILDEGEFVVIRTAMEGGSTGHDAYPDGHHVFCKRLNPDGTYNENGTEINFYQSGSLHPQGPKPFHLKSKIDLYGQRSYQQ